MKLTIEVMDSLRMAYLRRVGAYGSENKVQMEKLKAWAREKQLLNEEAVILGIAQDDPVSTRPDECRYDTGIIIDEEDDFEEEEILTGRLPGGKYAIFEIAHTAEAVQRAWAELFDQLYNEGYQLDGSRPIMERYRVKLVNQHLCEICVPIL